MRMLRWATLFFLLLFTIVFVIGNNVISRKINVLQTKIEKRLIFTNLDYTLFPLQITVDKIADKSELWSFENCSIPFALTAMMQEVREVSLFCRSGNVSLPHSENKTTKQKKFPSKQIVSYSWILKNYKFHIMVDSFTVVAKQIDKNMPLDVHLSEEGVAAQWGDEQKNILFSFSFGTHTFSLDMNSFDTSFSYKKATIAASVGGWCKGKRAEESSATCDIYFKDIIITHPTLDSSALQLPFLRLQGVVKRNWRKQHCFLKKGRVSLGTLDGGFTFSCRKNDFDLSLFSYNLRLADLATLLSAKQLDRYRMQGEIAISIASIGTLSPFHVEDLDIDGNVINPTQEGDRLAWLLKPFSHTILLEDGTERIVPVNRVESGEFLLIDLLPKYLAWSVVLSEDAGFYKHHGIDFSEVNQVFVEINEKQRFRGGSTITQQLAKNLLLTRDRTLVRKFKELLLAIEIDATISKRRALNIYLSIIEWAPGVYGIEEASRFYFGKEATLLTVLESAYLATIISCPTKCSVHFYKQKVTEKWMNRVYRIVELLYQHEKISTEEYVEALRQDVIFRTIVLE